MAASAEVTSEKVTGIKGVLMDKVGQVQTRIKDVEQALKTSVEQVQHRLHGAGEDSKKRLEAFKDSLKLEKIDELLVRFKVKERAHDLMEEGVKLTEETIEKLGLAKVAEIDMVKSGLESLKEALESLNKKIDAIKKRVSEAVSKKDFDALSDRVDAVEKKVAVEAAPVEEQPQA